MIATENDTEKCRMNCKDEVKTGEKKKKHQIPSARIVNRMMFAGHFDGHRSIRMLCCISFGPFEWWHYAGRHCDDFYNLLMLCHSFYRHNQDASTWKRKCSREYHPKVTYCAIFTRITNKWQWRFVANSSRSNNNNSKKNRSRLKW